VSQPEVPTQVRRRVDTYSVAPIIALASFVFLAAVPFIPGAPVLPGLIAAGCAKRPVDVASSVRDATCAALKALQCCREQVGG